MKALVPTCNRPEMFLRLAGRLPEFEVFGFVNNTSLENIEKYRSLILPGNSQLIFTDISGEPKHCHVETFRLMLNYASDDCLIIEDDIYPCDNFLFEITARIDVLRRYYNDFAFSPLYQPFRNSDFYSGSISRRTSIGNFDFIDSAWIDGNFFMTKNILLSMKEWIQESITIYTSSSGIGRRNSFEINRRGWKMFTAVPTLVEHLDHDSVMFGERRKQVPLISKFETF